MLYQIYSFPYSFVKIIFMKAKTLGAIRNLYKPSSLEMMFALLVRKSTPVL